MREAADLGYATYLVQLLAPLGIYTFHPGSISKSELESIGLMLDGCAAQMEETEREALVPTAEDWGLEKIEALFAKKPAAPTLALRRAAIAALTQIGGDDFTLQAINRALSGCGVTAEVAETAQAGRVRVTFPNTAGIPEEFDRIAEIILDIIPCHLETEFYFRYLTWAELEVRFPTWGDIEQAGHTWETLELAVV